MRIAGVELIENGDMVCHHQERTGKPFESVSLARWVSACSHGVALDIGAYTGLYAIAAAKAGAHAVAFEPNEKVFQRLTENVFLNGVDVDAYNVAVGSKQGRAALKLNRGVELTSGGTLINGDQIPVVSIDFMHLQNVTAIKIDVEGHECEVLRGAMETIKRDRPLVITEALTADAAVEQSEILSQLDYIGTLADGWNYIWSQSVAC